MITNSQSGTTVDEIAAGIYRISTPVTVLPGGFTFNQYLVVDETPLLFHAGLKRMFPLVREAVAAVMPVERLGYIGLSHFEADECGALNDWLTVAPSAVPVCSAVGAMVSINDVADRPAHALAHGDTLLLGSRRLRWLDAPHAPHGWDCGYLFDEQTQTLLSGDLFTQGGADHPPLTQADILGPSEAFRRQMDYYAHAVDTRALLERLAEQQPTTLACMHGSAWRGDGAALLRALADAIEGKQAAGA
ncbi:MAG: MBL fold metallo-hydrolase [Bryobacteraceae bacterium]|nr:MBL fold metallo-hydrolase [Bryobacteraceae bacterium]